MSNEENTNRAKLVRVALAAFNEKRIEFRGIKTEAQQIEAMEAALNAAFPPDTPRPTSDLVKRLRAVAEDNTVSLRHLNVTAEDTLWWEAAASIQALEERNKELEGALTRIANMVYAGAPDIRMREIARAALHPATKTGET